MRGILFTFVVSLILLFAGCKQQADVKPYTEQRTRTITLVDVYERYDDYGEPNYRGVFMDNKLGFEFRYGLNRADYVKFQQDRTPRAMTVKESLHSLGAPGTPTGKIAFGVTLGILGVLGLILSGILGIVHLSNRAEQKKERQRRQRRDEEWMKLYGRPYYR